MSLYTLAPSVEEDLQAIWLRIAGSSVAAADRLEKRFYQAFELLARQPLLGRVRPDLTTGTVRFWPVAPYMVVYRLAGNRVEVLAVVHSARNFDDVLLHIG